tara:strand:+ start:1378 stop:1539 length:162 start_codon:yes stop_codon:yes gene_type:complete
MGIPWSHIDKEDYEETYGERVIYCRVHHITGIDGCIACEQEEQGNAEEEEHQV